MLLNCGVGEDFWVLWTARRSNQSILKEISPEYSLEGLMLKLKLQLWLPDEKSWLIWKDPDGGKDWRRDKGMTEDEMVGWHQLNGHGFGWIPGVGDGQGGLVCCDSWGHRELAGLSDWTELNWESWGRDTVDGRDQLGSFRQWSWPMLLMFWCRVMQWYQRKTGGVFKAHLGQQIRHSDWVDVSGKRLQ